MIIAHLNINFLYNKFEGLKNLIHGKVDLLILSETKINDSFTTNQFLIEGFSPPPPPFRKDRDAHGGGLVIYVREDIPSNLLKPQTLPENIEAIFIELNLKNNKWLLIGGYNPNKNSISYFLNRISHEIDTKLHKYENLLL